MQAIETKTELTAESKLPHLITSLPGPKAKQIVDRDHAILSPSYTRDYPLVAKKGRGAVIEDVDGNQFLDFAAGIAVVSTGHCHPQVVAAIQKQAAELIHMSGTDFYYPSMVELAEKLAAIAPGKGPKRVYFGNSGTEAVESRDKACALSHQTRQADCVSRSFHGRTIGALSLTASKAVQRKDFGLCWPEFFTPTIRTLTAELSAIGQRQASAIALSYIENELFKRIVDPEESLGLSSSRFKGKADTCRLPRSFCKASKNFAVNTAFCMIADEVQSGMGRSGKWWASDHAGIEPDIICSAKGIASGMPLSAMIAKADVMDWKPGAHASTFGGNPGLHCRFARHYGFARAEVTSQTPLDGRIHHASNRELARAS